MKITKVEERLLAWGGKHRVPLLYAAATLLSLAARFLLRGVISGDMEWFLIPWAGALKENGGILALGEQVGNYGVLYQTVIALMTYLPIQIEYAYKLFSILFDYALAAVCAVLVRDLSGSGRRALGTYAFVTMLPTVALNSAAWGQCDSVYAFFCVLCFLLLLRNRITLAFLSYGMAFAFKLQAVFLAPFLILYYLTERKFSLLNFLWIPVVMTVTSLGGILEGRSVLAPFEIYLEQTGYYSSLFMNYPSFWALMTASGAEGIFQRFSGFCVLSALAVLLAEVLMFLKKRNSFSRKGFLFAAFLLSYSCVLFLPDMHERYSYLYVILGLMLAVLEPRTLASFALLVFLDLQTYGAFLFDPARYPSPVPCAANPTPYPMITWLSLINVLCFLSYLLYWGKLFLRPGSGSIPPEAQSPAEARPLREENR